MSSFAYNSPGYYVLPADPYVVTASISGTFYGCTVLSASANNYLSKVLFPYVSMYLNITNTEVTGSGSSIKFGFNVDGIAGVNYFTLAPQQTMALPLRTPILFLSSSTDANFELVAGLSINRVSSEHQFPMTGSGIG